MTLYQIYWFVCFCATFCFLFEHS